MLLRSLERWKRLERSVLRPDSTKPQHQKCSERLRSFRKTRQHRSTQQAHMAYPNCMATGSRLIIESRLVSTHLPASYLIMNPRCGDVSLSLAKLREV